MNQRKGRPQPPRINGWYLSMQREKTNLLNLLAASMASAILFINVSLPAFAERIEAGPASDSLFESTSGSASDKKFLAAAGSNTPHKDVNEALEVIDLPKPDLTALITIDDTMNPYELEAGSSYTMRLREALQTAEDRNLAIGISQTQVGNQKWTYLNSLTRFLPDVSANYLYSYAKGQFFFPLTRAATVASSSGTASSASIITPSNNFTSINSAFTVAAAGFSYSGYQGGKVVFGALQNRNLLRAQRASSRATISDTLLLITNDYYNLLLAEALLQIRIRAVDTSVEQLRINTNLAQNGLATNLDVLQSKTQLSRDRQNLIDQQVARRASSITLAHDLNVNLGQDIAPAERNVRKIRLIGRNLKPGDLLTIAIDNRPELKQYEELRKAAKKAIVIAAAPLQPNLKLSGYVIGLGPWLSNLQPLYTIFMGVSWGLGGLGTRDLTNIQAAKYTARQRGLEAQQEVILVLDQVRNSLLHSLQSERKITETADEVASAQEELRLSKIRFENGLGNNIDVINAQRDLTTAYIDRAQAIINFNIAQAQLLHDIGLTSIDNITSGKAIMDKPAS
jgi:outer membrane protein TolC